MRRRAMKTKKRVEEDKNINMAYIIEVIPDGGSDDDKQDAPRKVF